MTKTHWAERSQHWGKIGPPLQPNQEVIDTFISLIPADKHILLMGVTPQIANAYTHIRAIDYSPSMIERVWPGDTETKEAFEDNWLTVDLEDNQFDGVLGDGSINMVSYGDNIRLLFERIYGWLKPEGTFAMRFFTRPADPVTREQLLAEIENPTVNFSAFRRLLPMYIAATEGSFVPTRRMLEVFDELVTDRSMLKWDPEHVVSIDAYKDTDTTSWFPTRDEILGYVPKDAKNVRFIDTGTYDIAITCPILTFTK
jgi:SAM-dependent methyltransferase